MGKTSFLIPINYIFSHKCIFSKLPNLMTFSYSDACNFFLYIPCFSWQACQSTILAVHDSPDPSQACPLTWLPVHRSILKCLLQQFHPLPTFQKNPLSKSDISNSLSSASWALATSLLDSLVQPGSSSLLTYPKQSHFSTEI